MKLQCTKEFWQDPERKRRHGEAIKNSLKHKEGIKLRPSIAGCKNPMYGKKHTKETKEKMSLSRTGKIGENATGWKGGKKSFNYRIKSSIQRKYNWFHRVIDRDKVCQDCGINKKLDAHHKDPLSRIAKKITEGMVFQTDDEKYNFVISHPEIIDENLTNGITLCRTCHKKVHTNWGSHEI